MVQQLHFVVIYSMFVRSLFAHCSLFVRFIGEGTEVIMHKYSK